MRLAIKDAARQARQGVIALDNGAIDITRAADTMPTSAICKSTAYASTTNSSAPCRQAETAAKTLNLKDALQVRSQVIIAQPPEQGKPPDVYWDGQLCSTTPPSHRLESARSPASCVSWPIRWPIDRRASRETPARTRRTLYDQPFKKVQARFEIRKESPR